MTVDRTAPGAPAQAEGASFTPAAKGLATLLVCALGLTGASVVVGPFAGGWPSDTRAALLVCLLPVAVGYASIMRSRTSLDRTHIRQRGWWSKQVAVADIVQARLIDVRGWHWLIAPRLVVRVRGRGLTTFHAADPVVLQALRALVGQAPACAC